MGLQSRRSQQRRVVLAAALGGVLAAAMALGSWAPIGSATMHRNGANDAKRSSVLVTQTSIPLGSCAAHDIEMRVAVSRSPFTPSQSVDVIAVVRNIGRTVCSYGGNGGGNQYIGPCGAFSMTVLDSHGSTVWPGPVAYSCPMIGPTRLAPGTQVIATGTWPKSVVTRSGSRAAPPGSYRVIIAGRIALSIRLK
jgi:hypothetical protein